MPSNPFGLLAFLHWNHEWNRHHFPETLLPRAVRQIRELGVGFVRIDILWSDVAVGATAFDFARYDRLVDLIKKEGLHILAVLQYNKDTGDALNPLWNRPPDSFDDFAQYVGATVAHFKNRIRHWEIWNEPNLPIYWAGPKDGLRLYSSLLKKSYAAAKHADPECVVLNGGLTEPIIHDVENLYRNGAKDFFDILNIHSFINPHSPAVETEFDHIIHGISTIMEKHGDMGKKIWITEMGCPGVPADKEDLTWFAGKALNEQQQAAWVEQQTGLVLKHKNIERVFWAFYRDTLNEFNDAVDYFGLVRFDLTPKPAYDAMQRMIKNFRQTD
jgi:polysaccharide biosynthesis protein PslG